MNLNDETICRVMAEMIAKSFDQMVIGSFLRNARTSPSGVDWVGFEPGPSQGTYYGGCDTAQTGDDYTAYTKSYETVYTTKPVPASMLEIEGEYSVKDEPGNGLITK